MMCDRYDFGVMWHNADKALPLVAPATDTYTWRFDVNGTGIEVTGNVTVGTAFTISKNWPLNENMVVPFQIFRSNGSAVIYSVGGINYDTFVLQRRIKL